MIIVETLSGRTPCSVIVMRAVLFCLVCLFSLIPNLGRIAALSGVALFVYAYLLFALGKHFIDSVQSGSTLGVSAAMGPSQWQHMGRSTGSLVSAFEGVVVVQHVYLEMKLDGAEPFREVLFGSFACVAVVYAVFGCLGYITYGDRIEDIVYRNFPQDSADVVICELVLCVTLFVSLILQLYPVVKLIESMLLPVTKNHEVQDGIFTTPGDPLRHLCLSVLVRWSLVAVISVLAVMVPGLVNGLDCLGGYVISVLTFILPSVCHAKLNYESCSRAGCFLDAVLIGVGIGCVVLTAIS